MLDIGFDRYSCRTTNRCVISGGRISRETETKGRFDLILNKVDKSCYLDKVLEGYLGYA